MLKDVKIMSRIKRFFGIILSWIVVMSVYFIPACAAEAENGEVRVFDFAGLFSQEEKEELEEEALRLREELKAEFIVLTVDETRGHTAQEMADEYYFSHGYEKSFDEDGAVVLIDMDNWEIYLGTYGIMIRVITDVHKGIVAGQYNYDRETGRIQMHYTIRWYEALVAAAVSAAIAGFACQGVARSYRMKSGKEKESKLAYQENALLQSASPVDQLMNTAVHHTVIPRQNTSGRSSGSSSSRRSTTHSHSGHRAGGGGRRF